MINQIVPTNQPEGKEEMFFHYKFVTFEKDGTLRAKMYNTRAKKEWNQQVYHYIFKTEEQRTQWIEKIKAGIKSWEDQKQKRADERKNFINDYKPGEILYSSWGYEQTNIDFYQVIESKGKMIKIREIAGKLSDYVSHGMAAHTKAVKDAFIKDAPIITKRVSNKDYITFNSYSSLSRWDGQALYCSWYG